MIYHSDALTYIKETPQILLSILKSADQITEESRKLLKDKEISELYLVGLGSSYHSAKAVYVFLQDLLGIRVYPVCPLDFMSMRAFIRDGAVVMGISQQGTSTGVISVMDKMQKAGIPVIAVTGEHDTEITRHGDATLYVECGYEDAGATTKGFTATMLTLMIFGMKLWACKNNIADEQKNVYEKYIRNIFTDMSDNLEKNREICEKAADTLAKSHDLVLLAGDRWKDILSEVVLKFSETCRFPVRGFEAEVFMHGLYNAVNDDTDFLFLWDKDSEELKKLYQYYKAKGNKIICMGRNDTDKEQMAVSPENDETIFSNQSCFSVLRDILSVQQLFVLTSKKRGINLNIPKDPDFHKIMGSKLEKENGEL